MLNPGSLLLMRRFHCTQPNNPLSTLAGASLRRSEPSGFFQVFGSLLPPTGPVVLCARASLYAVVCVAIRFAMDVEN